MKPSEIYKTPAWKYFSRYILLYYSDGLFAKCFTCGKMLQINTSYAHCGHLIRVTESYATVFEFSNTGVQCLRCNRYLGGRQDIMYRKLVEIHGEEAIQMLYIKKHNICKLDKFSLEILAGHWKEKYKELVKLKGGDPWKK